MTHTDFASVAPDIIASQGDIILSWGTDLAVLVHHSGAIGRVSSRDPALDMAEIERIVRPWMIRLP